MELQAPPHWQCVDFISDLHLQSADRPTFAAWVDYMQSTRADALFILGDLFEVWVGDDALLPDSFEAECVSVLRDTANRLPLFIMQGNRDFLIGPHLIEACNAKALPDPSVMCIGNSRLLLSHGDALCVDDLEYQAFRAQVRSAAWQTDFLAKPLTERLAIARGIRQASESKKQSQTNYADVDNHAAIALMRTLKCAHLLHGHTHKPGQHQLDSNHMRTVLSDWDVGARIPRAEVLRLTFANNALHMERIAAALIASSEG